MNYFEKNLVVGPFQCNCRILVCPKTGEAALIDPGDESGRILDELGRIEWVGEDGRTRKPRLKWILHTHAHLDHIGGTRGVVDGIRPAGDGPPPAWIALHKEDLFIYESLREQGRMFGLSYEDPLPVTKFLEHGERLEIGSLRIEVIHTPGHSPGSVGFRLYEDSELGAPETVFSGDTLFKGSVGRTDLWGADGDRMFEMIRERLLTLDGDTRVCPGHGPDSTIGVEKRENPFLR
jgi:glyoxylase-like metal-dependent hydrolase (beta-lactamase superfamily II)